MPICLRFPNKGDIQKLVAVALATPAITLSAPAQVAINNTPSFAVASIKPTKISNGKTGFKILNGRFIGESVTVRLLIAVAYGLQDFQVLGGPSWIDSDTFNVEGKAETNVNSDQVALMLQSLLANRFKLTIHRDTKEHSIYALVTAKDGPKIKHSFDQTTGDALGPHGSIKIGPGSLIGKSIPLPLFISLLGRQLNRTIVNKTELAGRFDIALQWTPDENHETTNSSEHGATQSVVASPFPSLLTAVQEQLGLKLQSSKALTGVLVIDGVEKPSEN